MALSTGTRSGLKKILAPSYAAVFSRSMPRELHCTEVKRMGGGHGHDSEPFYVHAKHMYNLDRMKHQKLKMTLSVLTAFSIGVGVPVYAVIFQQRKTGSV